MLNKILFVCLVYKCLLSSAYAALYCGSEDETSTQQEICSIFEKVESGQGCSSFQDSVGHDVCLSLQTLMAGKNCTDEFLTPAIKEHKINTLITCHEIYYGMQEESCEHSLKDLSRSWGLHFELDRYLPPASRKALCMLGKAIPKNRLVFTELRKNSILMASIEPLIEQVFLKLTEPDTARSMKEVRNLASHVLKRVDELKIGKNSSHFLEHKLKHLDWILFFKDLVRVIDKNSETWISKSAIAQKSLRFDAGSPFGKDELPAGVLVFPDGRIIVFFDRLKVVKHKERPLKSIGEGGYKKVYLAFDYKKSIEEPSDGFNDPSTLVGGYIKSHSKDLPKDLPWDEDLFREIQEEVQFQKKGENQEGIAKKGELVSLYGQTDMAEKLVILEPYYPLDLIRFRSFLNNPEIESINGMTREKIVFKVAKNLLTGLSFLHSNGINHRDIKPDNILIDTEKDGSYHGFIADFGLALDLSPSGNASKQNKIAGTVNYMSPEYVKELGQIGERAKVANQSLKNDVWAMGLTLYFMVTGRLHPEGAQGIRAYEDLDARYGIKFSSKTSPSTKSLQYIIYRMLNPDESKRISSQEALALFQDVQVEIPYSSTDYLAEVHVPNKVVPFEQKNLLREVNLIERDSRHRFKKELLKHKNE